MLETKTTCALDSIALFDLCRIIVGRFRIGVPPVPIEDLEVEGGAAR